MGRVTQATTEVTHESITLRVPTEWLDRLDAWRATQIVPPKRADVIRLAVLQFIERKSATSR